MQITIKSLVQYKKSPAIVIQTGDKIEIQLSDKSSKRVRPKDMILLYTEGCETLDFEILIPSEKVLFDTCELMEDEVVSLTELTELLFNRIDAQHVWSAWQMVSEDVYFSGKPDAISCNGFEYAQAQIADQTQKLKNKQAHAELIERLKSKQLIESDFKHLSDIESLAFNMHDHSYTAKEINLKQSPDEAHRYLCEVNYWQPYFNPYLARNQVEKLNHDEHALTLPDEKRVDLTAMKAWAIDDEGNTDPDDAISIDVDGKIWVHIADVSALVARDSLLDEQAFAQGLNLYLPEGVLPMLPHALTDTLGLGLHHPSPALSIGFDLNDGMFSDIKVCKSLVEVTRVSYEQADLMPEMQPYQAVAEALCARRPHAVNLQFPEVKVSVNAEQVASVQKLPAFSSRKMIMEFMLAAGVATAQFAKAHQIPLVYSTQTLPNLPKDKSPNLFSKKFALRAQMTKSVARSKPEPHDGLGLDAYVQVTSPLRRYYDLINHQQLRAFLCDKPLLSADEISKKINQMQIGRLIRAERESNRHWKCVYLLQQNKWQGEAIIMACEPHKTLVFMPDLALELRIKAEKRDELDMRLMLKVTGVDLYLMEPRFKRI